MKKTTQKPTPVKSEVTTAQKVKRNRALNAIRNAKTHAERKRAYRAYANSVRNDENA